MIGLTGFVVLSIVTVAACWKPVSGPSAFSVHQTLPALGASSSLIHPTSSFFDETARGSGSVSAYDGLSEERVLNGNKNAYYGNKIFEGGNAYGEGGDSQCSVDKYALEYEGTLRYQHQMPKLDELTLCAWTRFTNHSGDHTIFTYSVNDEAREIQMWVANARGASFISLAIHGQALFRLNYPLRTKRWHHMCASWNGKTGEWQLWVKAERVGRGFYNRLVGHTSDANGYSYSGGSSSTGPTAEGLHFEVTMVQLYKVALSAGKAHRDHKHHHVHHFDHEGPASTMAPPQAIIAMAPQPLNPLLANGQIPTRVRINLAGAQNNLAPEENLFALQGAPQPPALFPPQQQATINTQFVNGQFHAGGRTITQQLLNGNLLQPQNNPFGYRAGPASNAAFIDTSLPSNVQFLDGGGSIFGKQLVKRQAAGNTKHTKRALVQLGDGSIIDDSYEFDGLARFGAPEFKDHLSKMMLSEEEIKEYDREPAEEEVQAVKDLCSVCEREPFEGAIVLAWKDTHIDVEHGLHAKSTGGCGHF